MGLVSELHDQSDLLNRAKELSFKFLRRDRKKLQIIKADSLASLKQQIKRVKNKFTENYDDDVVDGALEKSQYSFGRGSNNADAKNLIKKPISRSSKLPRLRRITAFVSLKKRFVKK